MSNLDNFLLGIWEEQFSVGTLKVLFHSMCSPALKLLVRRESMVSCEWNSLRGEGRKREADEEGKDKSRREDKRSMAKWRWLWGTNGQYQCYLKIMGRCVYWFWHESCYWGQLMREVICVDLGISTKMWSSEARDGWLFPKSWTM